MNKVTCNDSGHSGVVHLMSTCGKLALVRWDNGQTPMWRNADL